MGLRFRVSREYGSVFYSDFVGIVLPSSLLRTSKLVAWVEKDMDLMMRFTDIKVWV